MGFLTRLGIAKIKQDADRFLLSAQACTVKLESSEVVGGTYNEAFKRYEGGTTVVHSFTDIKAEKVILTETELFTLKIGGLKLGDVIFRFHRDLDLGMPNLVIIHNEITYYPIIFSPTKKDLVLTPLGNTQLFQNLLCSTVKGRKLEND